MVYSVIQTFRLALKYRGGWRGLLEHMYTVSEFVVESLLFRVFFDVVEANGSKTLSLYSAHLFSLFFLSINHPQFVLSIYN